MSDPCERCDNTGWVDEGNPTRPWAGCSIRADATEMGAGVPCPDCNPSDQNNPPRWPSTAKTVTPDMWPALLEIERQDAAEAAFYKEKPHD